MDLVGVAESIMVTCLRRVTVYILIENYGAAATMHCPPHRAALRLTLNNKVQEATQHQFLS